MIKRLTVILLVGVICLLGASLALAQGTTYNTLEEYETLTGNKIGKFNEAPMLRTMVAAGEIPPVEERLPEEPLVIEPVEEIGQYGGSLYLSASEGLTLVDFGIIGRGLFYFSGDGTRVIPDLAKGYEISEDKKTVTVYLRKGVKWSDGVPFTVEDILFWWEDEAMNKEINPVVWGYLKPGGKVAEFEKVDDYTFRLHFAVPNPGVMSWLGHGALSINPLIPKHYLKKFHIKYNPGADELAKKEGYDHWWQLYNYHRPSIWSWDFDVDCPTLGPWKRAKVTSITQIAVRNPYFWKVDTSGNQLPYIDEVLCNVIDLEVLNMRVVSGDIDLACFDLLTENYPFLKEGEKQGGYRAFLWKYITGGWSFMPNLNHKDPVLRKIIQDVRFRQALSLAIDREEINEVLFFGKGTPRQATVLPSVSFYKEEWGESYAQYDPKRANALLDEMGLDKRDAEGYRLRPDGKTLALISEFVPGGTSGGPGAPTNELVREYWGDIGIKVSLKADHRSFYEQRVGAGEHDVGSWHTSPVVELFLPGTPLFWYPISMHEAYMPQWRLWFTTEGESGEEPPEYLKEYVKTFDEWNRAVTKEEYTRLAQEIWDFHAKHLFLIGTVALFPQPVVAKDNLRNISEEYLGYGWDTDFFAPYQFSQLFWKQ